VLLVSGEYPPDVGGLADYTACLRRALAERGLDIRVATRARPAAAEPGVARVVHRWNVRALGWLARLAPDGILHLQYQPAAFDLLGDICLAPLVLRRLRPDTRVVTTFHDARVPYLFRAAGPLRRLAPRLLARTSAAVLASDARDLQALGAPAGRSYRVPIGSNVACRPPSGYQRTAFRATLGLAPDQLGLAYFGLLNASKGLPTLLRAFAYVLEHEPQARLLLLGAPVGASDASDRLTAERVSAALDRFGQRVLSTGYLPADLLSAHLLAADVALLPYADGASPRRGSLLACAAHGLPIVSTAPAAGGLDEVVLAAPADDGEALGAAVLRVATDPDLRERLRRASARLAEQTAWERIAEHHLAIYRAVADRHAGQ
jgi:glycosyltransferase involved in cell wall biosynthesis